MNMRNQNTQMGGFEVLRTPSGAVDFDAYQLRGRREQARAVKAAFSWLNDRFIRTRK